MKKAQDFVELMSENGVWDKETTLRKIKSENLEDQIVFATEKSLKYIKFVEMEVQYHE